MIRDRGRIKWTSLMLPEHVKILREWAREDEWAEKAELDEQRLEELDQIVQTAFAARKQVMIRLFKKQSIRTISGTIEKIEPIERVLRIRTEDGKLEGVPVRSIEEIEIL